MTKPSPPDIIERRRKHLQGVLTDLIARDRNHACVIMWSVANEPLPKVGQLSAVVDSQGRRVAAIEVTEVRVVRLADVDLQHALDEGEGDESVAQWRAGHERFWHSPEARAELGDASFSVNDDTLIVAERFRLVHRAEDFN